MLRTLEPNTVASRTELVRESRRTRPPVVLLGGGANALSAARSLGRAGVEVFIINDDTAYVRYSRYVQPIEAAGSDPDSWARFLTGRASDTLRGAVLLACSDDGIELIARHRDELSARFLLDESNPTAQLAMLNKLSTYQSARAAGVPTPRFWEVESREQVAALRDALVFPLIVKPHFTHRLERRSGMKFVIAGDFDQLLQAHEAVRAAGLRSLLVEWIPGPDDRLCSYYTYLDRDGTPLFHFTKRIIRRFPAVTGNGCYHVTDWNPEVRDLALRLFAQVGLRGLANAEFKRDERDGRLKLIECNARFTASNGLVADSGFDLAALVYNRIVGLAPPPLGSYKVGLRLWDPVRDFQAYRELSRKGELTFPKWLASVLRPQTFAYFRWSDPLPALARAARPLLRVFRKRRGTGPVVCHDEGRRCPTS
jgi:predicted ATP-grasp superfamily ATP-dependent carboligase